MKKLSLICAVLLLSACGSGTSNYEASPPLQPPPATPPVVAVDSFFTLVMQYLTPTSEDTDATPIDEVVATQPEDTEPTEFS